MSKFYLYCEEFSDEFNQKHIKKLQRAVSGCVKSNIPLAVEVVFVDEAEIRRLNDEQRHVDSVTDVLSFPTLDDIKGKKIDKREHLDEIDENGNLLVGSIAVCIQRAKEQAIEYGHSYNRELHYLIVHGILHCLGYDHMEEDEKAEMREREELILKKLKITREDS